MNTPDSSTVNPTAKKISFSSATRALIVGLALLLPVAAALASNPIPGIDIIVQKKPGGSIIKAPTEADGAYQFKGLAAGDYDLSVGGKRVQTLRVGNDGGIKGVLSRQPDGKTTITFNKQVGVVPDEFPGAPVSTTRSNKKHAIVKAEQPPPDDLPGAPVVTTRSNKKAGMAKAEQPLPDDLPGERATPGLPSPSSQAGIAKAGEEANSALGQVSTTRGTAPGPGPDGGDVKPGISDQGVDHGLISYATAPPPPKSGEDKLPGLALEGEPIPGIDVKLGKNPGGSIVASSKTDSTGAFHFDKLPAGNYKLTLPGLPDQLLTVGGDGIAGGKLMKGSDGSLSIFDRLGNRTAKEADNDVRVKGKAAENPVSFGSGNTLGFGPGRGGGPGMDPGMRPGAGPAIGGSMSPGMGGGPTGPGGAMGGAGAGRH